MSSASTGLAETDAHHGWAESYRGRLVALAHRHGVPGAALAVVQAGVTHLVAAGVLNTRTGTPVTAASLFQIGSITKVMTASLVMTLVDEGRVDLDDLVARHVPGLELPDELETKLTVRDLLNHTSGLPADWFPDTGRGDDCIAKLVQMLPDVGLAHGHRELTSYSNSAFSLAGHLVACVTGTSWDTALRDRLLAPLGLDHVVTLPEEALLHSAAVGHAGAEQRPAHRWQPPRACGPAGLVCASAADTARFGALFVEPMPTSSALSAEARALMTEQTSAFPVSDGTVDGVGLGWGVGSWSGRRLLAHDGSTIGQAAALRVLPDDDLVVALVTNGGDWRRFRDAVLDDVVPRFAAVVPPGGSRPPEDVGDVGDLLGSYERHGVRLTVTVEDGGAFVRTALEGGDEWELSEGPPAPVVAVGPGRYLVELPGSPQVWTPAALVGGGTYLHLGRRAARRVGR